MEIRETSIHEGAGEIDAGEEASGLVPMGGVFGVAGWRGALVEGLSEFGNTAGEVGTAAGIWFIFFRGVGGHGVWSFAHGNWGIGGRRGLGRGCPGGVGGAEGGGDKFKWGADFGGGESGFKKSGVEEDGLVGFCEIAVVAEEGGGHSVDIFRRGIVCDETGEKFCCEMACGRGVGGEAVQQFRAFGEARRGGEGFAENDFFATVVGAFAEEEGARVRIDGPSGEDACGGENIRLGVTAIDTEGVEFEEFASEVFIESAAGRFVLV